MTLQMLTGDALSWDALFLIVFAIGPWGVGVALRRAYQQGRVLAAEAERARADRRHEAERAAAEERRRIARELHDVLSNGLSVMVVQAALAAELAGTGGPAGPPAEAAERAGRAALAETARLLALLRNGGRDTHPARGVADLRALADDYGRAGLGVELHVDGVGALSAGIDLSTYRIVREGLTNALKHAPGSPVQVRLARRDAELAIEVRNGRAGARPPAAISGGHGLVGLRERVTLFGGRFDAGATADGGFVVAATLPVDEAP
jgi:signal transduction histidine kinase